MTSLTYNIQSTNDKFTSRSGLIVLNDVLNRLDFNQHIDALFPKPGSNRGYAASTYVKTFVMMLNEGGRCLQDVRHLHAERDLCDYMGIGPIPSADAMGDWLRRWGQDGVARLCQANRAVLDKTLANCRSVTLDIDASAIHANKKDAQYTYLKEKGYMPMIGHIAETGQVVAVDFRAGNVPPNSDNLQFIHLCQQSLPDAVQVKQVRIDAAGYQYKVINDLEAQQIGYVIRAKMNAPIKELIADSDKSDWQPLIARNGKASEVESVYRTVHTMDDTEKAFELVIQRRLKDHDDDDGQARTGACQMELPLGLAVTTEQKIESHRYVYRAIATNLGHLSTSEIVHFYNQRGECSENRIKELKLDFAAQHLPCSEFDANALYLSLCALAYNVFVLLRQVLPCEFETMRVTTVRLRLYDMAGKIVRHARQVCLKLNEFYRSRLQRALMSIEQLLPVP